MKIQIEMHEAVVEEYCHHVTQKFQVKLSLMRNSLYESSRPNKSRKVAKQNI